MEEDGSDVVLVAFAHLDLQVVFYIYMNMS